MCRDGLAAAAADEVSGNCPCGGLFSAGLQFFPRHGDLTMKVLTDRGGWLTARNAGGVFLLDFEVRGAATP